MKKIFLKLFTLLLLFSFIASPAIGQTGSPEVAASTPSDLERPTRPEPELLPQEVLDLFEGGMPIEEFLIRNQGPIPNALLDYADMPVVVVVELEDPPLAEYVVERGLTRDASAQETYVAQLERTQAGILSQITAGRSDVTLIGDTFTKVLNGFMLRVPARDLNQIREISGVKSVTMAPEHELNLGVSVPLIGADQVWTDPGFTGKGITVAVIDTGIDYTHAMFAGEGTPEAYDAIDPDIIETDEFGVPVFPTAKVIGGYDFAGTLYHAGCPAAQEAAGICTRIPQPDPNPIDEHSHGTHVAATVAGRDIGFGPGVAPDAELYALKVFGQSGSTNLTLHAIEWAMDPQGLGNLTNPVDVINMSLGANWGVSDKDSPQHIAVENAAAIGVVVVASAGNAGNSSYIVGSPSTANSAISVAAATTGFETAPYIYYEHESKDYYIPYNTTTGNPFTTTITAELVDVGSLGVAVTFCNADVEELEGTPLDGAIALISRGACTFDEKIINAETFGAVAAVVHNNAAGPFGMLTEVSTLPAAAILQSDGLILKDLAPIEVSIGPDSNTRTFVSAALPDTIATFSSRGPRGFDSKLKPEITAPGVAIFAADMGTGDLGTSSSGTSMAAPHIAGVAALMVEAHTNWTSYDIKAAMMNTAVDLADSASAQIPRQGAGRVDALEAVNTSVVAFGDPRLISLSWGVIEIGEDDYTDIQTVTLRNFTATPETFNVDAFFTSASTGATLTPSVTEVTVPAFGDKQVEVTLELDATVLPIAFSQILEEYYGFITFESSGETLRVPFYFVPRPYTELTELDAETTFDVEGYGYVELEQSGPVPSDLWAFPVSLVSPQNPNVLGAADLRYVGMDYSGGVIFASFAMWGDAHTNQPFFNEVDLYIDTPTGSVVNFNYNLAWLQGVGQNNQWIVIQVDFADGWVGLGSPWFITADYNSGVQEWWLPAAWQYVVDEFDYQVLSFDWYGNMDYGGAASFDITKPPLMWGLTPPNVNPDNEVFDFLFAVDDLAGYVFSDIAGIMLVDYFGKPGAGQSYFWPLDVTGISYLQVAHLAPFAEDASVTITLDGAPVLTDFDYGDSTEYLPLPAGEYDIAVFPSGVTPLAIEVEPPEAAIEATVELIADTYHTAIAIGDGANQDLDLILLEDDLTPPEEGMFHLRLGHLAPFAEGPATADVRLKDGTPVLEGVEFGDVTDFIPLPAGEYDLIITAPGGNPVLIDPVPVSFAEGDILSAFATGEGVNQDLGVFALPAGEIGFFLPLAEPEVFTYYFPLFFGGTEVVVEEYAYVQVAHLAPFAEDASVTITLNGEDALVDFGYGDSTEYIELLVGEYDIEVIPTGAMDPAIEATVELEADTYYTVIAIGDIENQDLALKVLVDDLTEPEAGKFHLRLGHLAPFAEGAATADVRLRDGTPVLLDVDFGDVTDFIPFDAGTYDLVITAPGGDPVLIDPVPVTFEEGDIVSAFATGEGVNQDLGVFALPAGEIGFFVPLAEYAYVQVVHLAPFAEDASVTITLNGEDALVDFGYGDSTEYIELLVGEYDIEVIPTGAMDPAIEATVELEADTYYTVIAIGDIENQDLALKVLVDDLTPPDEGKFHVRLGHLAPFADGPATADIREKDGTPVLLDVDFGDVTDFIPLDAGEYDLIITAPGGDPVLIDPIPVTFDEGDIVSAFATGEGVNQDLGVFALPAGEIGFFVPLKTAYVQVAHLAPFAADASVTITLNGEDALTEFEYGDSTEYIELLVGEYDIAVIPTGATDPAITATVELEADTYYTVLAVGDGVNQDLGLIPLVDDLTVPEAGKFHLRLGHLAPFAAGPATADVRLKDGTPVLLDVDFGDVTDFIPLDAGEYDLIITAPGDPTDILIDPAPETFEEGQIISAFATGDDDNQDLGVFALPAGEIGFFLPLVVEEVLGFYLAPAVPI